jgi:hypothetical protein
MSSDISVLWIANNNESLWERVSKQVTNRSKTVAMDVMGFLCVSLGSSRVQLHDSLGTSCTYACAEVGFSGQNRDHAREVCYQRAVRCCAFFFWGWVKGLNAKCIHKEKFPVYCQKCLSCKVVHKWVEKFSQGRSKVTNDPPPSHWCGSGCDDNQKTSMLWILTHW